MRENWNNTLVNGVRSGILVNYTSSAYLFDLVRNGQASPGLDYMDSEAHGYMLVTVDEEAMLAEQVNVGNVLRDEGPEGSAVLRLTRFRVPSWEGGAAPHLEGPEFEGPPPYPWKAGPTGA